MDWAQFIIFFVGVFGLFIWNRAESRADARKADQDNKELRRELDQRLNASNERLNATLERWAQESKDFHGRLCAIEERRLRLLMKE